MRAGVSYRQQETYPYWNGILSATIPSRSTALRGISDFLDEMEKVLIASKPSVKTYWDNGDQLLQSLRSEEVWAASAWEQAGWKLHAENPNIDYIAPTSGSLAWVDTFAIPQRVRTVQHTPTSIS